MYTAFYAQSMYHYKIENIYMVGCYYDFEVYS